MASWGHKFSSLKSTIYQKAHVKFGSYTFFFALEKKIFDFFFVSSFFKIISPLKENWPFKFYIILPNGPWEESFEKTQPHFHSFLILSFMKGKLPFIWTNFKPLHPNIPCAQIGWNWIRGSGEKRFWFISLSYLHSFLIIPPVKGSWSFFLTNLKALLQNILRAQSGWNWRRGSLNF